MAGRKCPKCGELTLFTTPTGVECSRCGYKGTVPVNGGFGGKGKKCPVCGNYQVFDGKCRNCGTTFSG